jgi:hypothetical protein
MWLEVNQNPKGRITNDCVVRAISALLNRSWDSVFWDVASEAFIQKDTMEMANVWGAVLTKNGYEREVIPNTCPVCYTVKDFCRDHPEGRFLLAVPGSNAHVIAVIDGDYVDTWRSEDLVPQFYWREK